MENKNLEGLFDRIRQHDQCRLAEIRTLKHQIEALQSELNQKNIVVKQLKLQVAQLCEFKRSILRSINCNTNVPELPAWEEDTTIGDDVKNSYEQCEAAVNTYTADSQVAAPSSDLLDYVSPTSTYNNTATSFADSHSIAVVGSSSFRQQESTKRTSNSSVEMNDSQRPMANDKYATNPSAGNNAMSSASRLLPTAQTTTFSPLNAGAIASTTTVPTATSTTASLQMNVPSTTQLPSFSNSSSTPSSMTAKTAAVTNTTVNQSHVGTGDAEGHAFFMMAKKQLTYPQFQSFLQLIKQFNQHERGKDETLASARDIFGTSHDNLYRSFSALLTRNACSSAS
jgi:hypothetical protein